MQFRFCDQDGPANHVYGCIHLFLLFGGELLKNVNINKGGRNLTKGEKEEEGVNFDQNWFISIVIINLRPML